MTVRCPFCDQELREEPRISIDGSVATIDGKRIHLRPSEQWIMEALLRRQGRVVTKDQLMSWLYSPADMPDETKIIDVFICKLRKVLEGTTCKIETEWGRGYRLVQDDV